MNPGDYQNSPFLKKEKEVRFSPTQLSIILAAVLEKGFSFRFRIKGCSMFPFIKNNDVITVSPILGKDIHVGDIVAFTDHKKQLVIHRVIEKKGNIFLIKGDYTNYEDGDLIARINIHGSVTKVERSGKYITIGRGFGRFFIAFLAKKGFLMPMLFSWANFVVFIQYKILKKLAK